MPGADRLATRPPETAEQNGRATRAERRMRVRLTALRALACDRCEEAACRPNEAQVLPHTIALLERDPDPHVRGMAIEVIGGLPIPAPRQRNRSERRCGMALARRFARRR